MATQAEKMLVIEAAFVKQARVIDDLKQTVSELQKDRLQLRDATEEIVELKRHISALTVSESIAKRKAETMEYLLAKERAENDRARQDRVERNEEPAVRIAPLATACDGQRGRATQVTRQAARASSAAAAVGKSSKGSGISVKSISHLETNFDSAQKKLPSTGETFMNTNDRPNSLKMRTVNPLSALPPSRNFANTDTLTALQGNIGLLKFVGCCAEDEAYLAATETDELVHLVVSLHSSHSHRSLVAANRFVCQLVGRGAVLGKERAVFRVSPGAQNGVALAQYLQDQLRSGKYFRVSELLSMLLDIAEGIDALHREGIMHGNLCPQNIFYVSSRSAPDGADSSSLVVSGYGCLPVAKNFRYTAPEALEQATAPSDVWAFGVLAWELCQYCAVQPLSDALSRKQFIEALQGGARLKCPEQCPPNVFLRIIRPCFSELTQRPSMGVLVMDISGLLQQVQ
jgi:hypothetical protein